MLVGNAGRHAWLQVVREYDDGLLRTPTNVSWPDWKTWCRQFDPVPRHHQTWDHNGLAGCARLPPCRLRATRRQ